MLNRLLKRKSNFFEKRYRPLPPSTLENIYVVLLFLIALFLFAKQSNLPLLLELKPITDAFLPSSRFDSLFTSISTSIIVSITFWLVNVKLPRNQQIMQKALFSKRVFFRIYKLSTEINEIIASTLNTDTNQLFSERYFPFCHKNKDTKIINSLKFKKETKKELERKLFEIDNNLTVLLQMTEYHTDEISEILINLKLHSSMTHTDRISSFMYLHLYVFCKQDLSKLKSLLIKHYPKIYAAQTGGLNFSYTPSKDGSKMAADIDKGAQT